MSHTFLNSLALFSAALFSLSFPASAQDYTPNLTEHGQPDLRGVWNFPSRTPLERPKRFGETEFLQDVDKASLSARSTRGASTGAYPSGVIGAYNGYWNDRNELQISGRTSLITHPRNGRIPPVRDGIHVQLGGDITTDVDFGESRPVRYAHGGVGRTGPEDRGALGALLGVCVRSATINGLLQQSYSDFSERRSCGALD
jgi:hypothetical protein